MKRQFKQRLLLVGVFAIFFVPVITAIVLRANPSFIGGFHTTNRGQLLSEARKITLPVAKSVGVDAHEALRFQDKWTLLTLNQGTCESSCRQRLTALYTAHTATNKDINRVP